MSTFAKKIIGGVFWLALEAWGRQLAALVIFVLLARFLGPGALGLAALAMSATHLLSIPLRQGLPDALVQGEDIRTIHFDSAFWFLSGAGLVFSVLIYLLATPLSYLFGEEELEGLIRLSSIIIFIRSLAIVPISHLRRRMEFRLFAIRSLAGSLIGGLVGVGMAYLGYGVWSLIGMQIAKVVSESAILIFGGNWLPRFRFQMSKCQELFGFSGPVIGTSLIFVVLEEIPKVFLGLFLDSAAVGVYVFARRILDLMTETLIRPLISMVMPAVSRMQDDIEQVNKFLFHAINAGHLIIFPTCFGFAAVSPIAVPLFFGEHWREAIVPLQLIMFLGVQFVTVWLVNWTVISLGHTVQILKINLVYLLSLSVVLFVTTRHGVETLIIGNAVIHFLFIPVYVYFTKKLTNIDFSTAFKNLPVTILASAIMYVVVYLVQFYLSGFLPTGIILGVSILMGVGVFSAVILVLMGDEIREVKELLLGLRNKPNNNS